MAERFEFGVLKGKLSLKTVKVRRGRQHPTQNVSLWARIASQRLISVPDTGNCRDLQERARAMLSTLTHQEQQVLRLRFGIGEARNCSVDEIAQRYALQGGDILEIEAQALRSLRHPSSRPLRSVSRR